QVQGRLDGLGTHPHGLVKIPDELQVDSLFLADPLDSSSCSLPGVSSQCVSDLRDGGRILQPPEREVSQGHVGGVAVVEEPLGDDETGGSCGMRDSPGDHLGTVDQYLDTGT